MDMKFNAKWAALLVLTAGFLQADKPTGAGAFIKEPDHSPRLFGKVKSIRTQVKIAILIDGEPAERADSLPTIVEYTPGGKVSRTMSRGADGRFKTDREFKYDDAIREMTIYSRHGGDESILTKFNVARYDENGRRVDEEYYFTEGKPPQKNRSTYTYDETGRVTQVITYVNDKPASTTVLSYEEDKESSTFTRFKADGSMESKTVNEWSSKGSSRTNKTHNANGSLETKGTLTYNDNRELTESVVYNWDGKLLDWSKYEYEYDSQGNWVKQTRLVCMPRWLFSLIRYGWHCGPDKVSYRAIEYYPDDAP